MNPRHKILAPCLRSDHDEPGRTPQRQSYWKITLQEERELVAVYAKGQDGSAQPEEQRESLRAAHILIEVNAARAFQIARGLLGNTIRYASHYAELEDRMHNVIIGLLKMLKNHGQKQF